jgi:hypothetical protein
MGLIALLFVMSGCSPGAPAFTPIAPLPTSTPTATPNPTASAPSLATPAATSPVTTPKNPDHASPEQTPEALDNLQATVLPAGFVTQILEPLGGKILRPKDWFYSEGHRESVLMWTISREDMSGNRPYTTGFRIQAFIGVEEHTGQTAKELILDWVAAKQSEAITIVSTCEAEEQYLFTRMCLETEEGPYHIMYSLFWGTDDDLDIAVITIAGTTKELWETYAPTFDMMGAFELIDMERFEE